MAYSPTPPPPKQLLDAFDGLPEVEKQVLQFFSILFESISRKNLQKCLVRTRVRHAKGRVLSITDLKPMVDKLHRLGLLEMEGYELRCVDAIAAHATRSAVDEGQFPGMAEIIGKDLPPFRSSYSTLLPSLERGWREIRIGVYAHDVERVHRFLRFYRQQYSDRAADRPPLATICGSPFDAQWFRKLPQAIQVLALEEMILPILSDFGDISEIQDILREQLDPNGAMAPLFRRMLLGTFLFQGNLTEAREMLDKGQEMPNGVGFQGWLHFLQGENEPALRCFKAALATLRKGPAKKKAFFPDLRGLFYLLALLKTGDMAQHKRIGEYLDIANNTGIATNIPAHLAIHAALLAHENKVDEALSVTGIISRDPSCDPTLMEMGLGTRYSEQYFYLTELFSMVARFWIDPAEARKSPHHLEQAWEIARKNGYRWPAMEIANLLATLGVETPAKQKEYADYAAEIQESTGMRSILPVVTREERWERALKLLARMGAGAELKITKVPSAKRLVWMLEPHENGVFIRPREQVCSAAGNWSKGRPVAFKRLFSDAGEMDFLTDQDKRVCNAISRDSDYYYGGETYEIDPKKAILAMVGHPLAFLEDSPKTNVEVVKAEPELRVQQKGGQISVELSDAKMGGKGIFIEQETPTRIKVIEVTAAHERIIEVLGSKGLKVPAAGKEKVLTAVQSLSSLMTVHSGIGGGAENIPDFYADRLPRIHLLPMGDGLKVSLLVRPFKDDGPYFQPGKGGQTIIAEVHGKRMQTTRNLPEEKKLADAVIEECPALAGMDDEDGGAGEWFIDEQDRCLELLLELQALGERVTVEWPEGEKLKVRRAVSTDNLRVKVRKDNDWFAMTGELQVDENLLLNMTQLLDLARDSEGRFVPIGEGQFIALTETFRRRLAEIEAFSEKSAKGRRFHGLAGLLLEDLADDVGAFEADKHWKNHIQHIHQAQELVSQVPSTLQAELRDYQTEGFQWLARLAAWGVGACLADDMGLGKTLQALALILSRATEGPCLVVAPTSVCLNWQGEIERFAPTLRAISFGGDKRQQMLDALEPFQVLISSYGLLQQESEMLSKVPWNVIVLDEAQAIKNRMTKRSQAAMALNGAFRLITTGTPIENHLGELWNLFRFINPGLLGSLEKFNTRFAVPIERYGEKATAKQLKKLIQPFILRRTKSQVLEELPPRTEIVLHVEMTPEETAFYEALRQQAVEQIENLDGPIEQKNFRILAELMRLRRACCNPRLVMPQSPIQSTKLALFREVVTELLENRHKALVFSQFVDHLAIIRATLDEAGVLYQYLDGSTPAKERKRRVDAFQAGTGDVFLISLKAGGLGINLTAADYVIHMDPWWNPAVEDQASDRAHRIGQQRPVTIYRLVTKDTIEEKIVELHRHKRDLADDLLEGGEMSGKMSARELLKLIREEG
uniref:Superfamily II DNA or RNA helicase, SNF2 family n=1 Tax=Candidatus Kentrum sp. DK TaxID=2126562 RepID=A0A450T3W6_9GAMM|nr:MAG: Superfamily II DNA or RNA helicase, SNF2 family [Candidatus Kentron sp. DK]